MLACLRRLIVGLLTVAVLCLVPATGVASDSSEDVARAAKGPMDPSGASGAPWAATEAVEEDADDGGEDWVGYAPESPATGEPGRGPAAWIGTRGGGRRHTADVFRPPQRAT